MKNLSNLKIFKAYALLNSIPERGGLTLTNTTTAQNLRRQLDVTRAEFDQIIDYLSEKNLVEIQRVFRTVALFLTPEGIEMCQNEASIQKNKP